MKNLQLKLILSLFVLIGLVTMSFALWDSGDKTESPAQEDLHWFQINTGVNRTPTQSVNPNQVTYLGQSATPPAGSGCGGSNYQCVSGFTSSQVTGSNQLAGPQIPANPANLKN